MPSAGAQQRVAADRCRILDPERIALSWGATTEVIPWAQVIVAQWVENCTVISTDNRTLKIRCPLVSVLERLAALGLVQVRRDVAVNAAKVRRLVGTGRHRLIIVLDDDRFVAVGREFQREVRARFGAADRTANHRETRQTT